MEVGAEVGNVSAVTPDTPPPPLPRVLVDQGLELRFDLAMMIHILTDLHVLGGRFPLGPGVAVLRVPLQPPHEAADDGQAGPPTHVLGAGHGALLWLWLWLLVRKLQGLVDVGVLLLFMRMLQGLADVRVLLAMDSRSSGSGYSLVSSMAPSGKLGLGTSGAVEHF